jgi:hypothetical protein
VDINVQRRCKGSRGYIISDRIGRSILGGYQCAEEMQGLHYL